MEISARLSKWKFHFLFGVAVSVLAISSPIYLSPKFVEIVAFFGPLFLSTALFLVAVVVFGRNLPVAEPHGEKAAEVILDLVTGQPVVLPLPTEEQDVIQNNKTEEEEEEVIKNNQAEEEQEEEVLMRNKQTEEEVEASRAESVESERKM